MAPASPRLIHDFLQASAQTRPHELALVHGEERLSYGELNRDANRIAHHLVARGIVRGDRVVLLLENCREYVAAYYGCLAAGAVAVPLNPDLKPENIASVLSATKPRAVILSARSERALQQLDLAALGEVEVLIARPRSRLGSARDLAEITQSGDASDPVVPISENDLASILFTSGTTGRPKGVMLTHRNIVANTYSIIEYLDLAADDVQMVVLPFFYVMGKSLLNTHVAVGGTVVINNTFAYPSTVVQQMIDENVTGFSGVPSTYAYLLHRSPLREVRDRLAHLRYCSQAGGHMARHIKEELLNALPEHTKLYVMYGATEASARLTYVEPARLRDKMDSIGVPIPGVTMSVRNEHGRAVSQGEIGELVASGDNIMLGYWRDSEFTAKVLTPHGYRTGDVGYRDADGYFYVMGRKDDQLKVSGHRVDPQEVEDALLASGLIVECVVVGVPDPLTGHRLVAIVVAVDSACTDRDVLRRASETLPRHKLPTEVKLTKTLPKSSSGKVDRQACLAMLRPHAERQAS
jgi:acyl-CoA synthetase (AMP-forming)/AMP-acid ligase II